MDFSNAWVNGRTLSKVIREYKPSNRFGTFGQNDQVRIKLPEALYALGLDRAHGTPFIIEEDLLVTVHDFDAPSEVVELPTIRFSERALRSASHEIVTHPITREVAALGASVLGAGPIQALAFSEKVCAWGGGHRVWGKLMKEHGPDVLGDALVDWFRHAVNTCKPGAALARGVAIKGLGVSYASKHLRHLAPDRFAVLDDVLSQGLGYAPNLRGYDLFLHDLERLQEMRFPDMTVSDIEAGLFNLVRQLVRSPDIQTDAPGDR
jgi:hypothetical protein